MNVAVVGCGRWGTFLAWYLDFINHNVTLYGRKSSNKFLTLKNTRKNEYVQISSTIKLIDNIETALENQ